MPYKSPNYQRYQHQHNSYSGFSKYSSYHGRGRTNEHNYHVEIGPPKRKYEERDRSEYRSPHYSQRPKTYEPRSESIPRSEPVLNEPRFQTGENVAPVKQDYIMHPDQGVVHENVVLDIVVPELETIGIRELLQGLKQKNIAILQSVSDHIYANPIKKHHIQEHKDLFHAIFDSLIWDPFNIPFEIGVFTMLNNMGLDSPEIIKMIHQQFPNILEILVHPLLILDWVETLNNDKDKSFKFRMHFASLFFLYCQISLFKNWRTKLLDRYFVGKEPKIVIFEKKEFQITEVWKLFYSLTRLDLYPFWSIHVIAVLFDHIHKQRDQNLSLILQKYDKDIVCIIQAMMEDVYESNILKPDLRMDIIKIDYDTLVLQDFISVYIDLYNKQNQKC